MMAKRLSDTEKWKDDWFLNLKPEHKLLWYYVLDNCDHAGIWKVSERLAAALIGQPIDLAAALAAFTGRIAVLNNGDYWLVRKFVLFQYGSLSNTKSGVATAVRKRLAEFGVAVEDELVPTLEPTLPPTLPPTPPGGVQEKEKDIRTKSKSSSKSTSLELFESFWSKYPRRVGRGAAEARWLRMTAEEQRRAIEALAWQVHSEEHLKREPQYTPHASTWLNQRRYDDPKPGRMHRTEQSTDLSRIKL